MASPGWVTGTGLPTNAEIAAHRAACIAASDVVNFTGAATTQTHRWSVKSDQAGSAPATLTDRTGTDNLSAVGTPTLLTEASPVVL